MAVDGDELIARVVALEEEATLAATSPPDAVDAVARFFHTQESFPYWTNRIEAIDVAQNEDSEDFDVHTYDVVGRLVIGHLTEAYSGVVEARLQTWSPSIILYFNERELLQSATYTEAMDFLIRARCLGTNGLRVFPNTGIGVVQVGSEFRLRCLFEEQIEQQYL